MTADLTNNIKRECLDAGFVKVGIAKVEKLDTEGIYLRKWLDEKRNADMHWMENSFEKRIDPALTAEGAVSVISLAYLYDTPVPHSENPDIPKISRYAWGQRDYHKVIKSKLKILCKKIEALEADIKTKFYIDDGPVMDKVWAVRSGIGAFGKHTNVINPEIGSFFFVATIFINRELIYDIPIDDLCKNCTLCMSSCPTGAIYEEYKVDANLCISYHTIENRKIIPDEIDLNGWIFGCDICQDVCPYNEKHFFTNEEVFFPKNNTTGKTYDELLNMNEDQFRENFQGTPVMRTKYNGFMRNLRKARPSK